MAKIDESTVKDLNGSRVEGTVYDEQIDSRLTYDGGSFTGSPGLAVVWKARRAKWREVDF